MRVIVHTLLFIAAFYLIGYGFTMVAYDYQKFHEVTSRQWDGFWISMIGLALLLWVKAKSRILHRKE